MCKRKVKKGGSLVASGRPNTQLIIRSAMPVPVTKFLSWLNGQNCISFLRLQRAQSFVHKPVVAAASDFLSEL